MQSQSRHKSAAGRKQIGTKDMLMQSRHLHVLGAYLLPPGCILAVLVCLSQHPWHCKWCGPVHSAAHAATMQWLMVQMRATWAAQMA